MIEIVGYAQLSKVAEGISPEPMEGFQDKIVRVMEFDRCGGVLVLNSGGTALGTFEKEHVIRFFKCKVFNKVIIPPNLDMLGQMHYSNMVLTRKGGYNKFLGDMVIAASLAKGEFEDSFLWMQDQCKTV